MRWIAIGVVVIAKFVVPVLIVPFPFAAGWAHFVLDTVDGDLLIPSFLEPLFLIYATIRYFKPGWVAEIYTRHRVGIWAFVVLYKLQDEWVTHVGNIDRTELTTNLFS